MPGAAFDDQFRQVDAAVRDLQVSNLQVPQTGTAGNAPYRNFRTSQLDPRMVPAVRYPDGDIFRVVPSRNVSVEVIPHVRSLVRHLSERPGSAHPGDSTDTRFGENRPISMLQDRAATSDEGSQDTVQQDTVTQLTNAQQNPNVVRNSGDIEEGPIHMSRGTFYAVRPVPGYPPPLHPPNVPNRSYDFQGPSGGSQGYGQPSTQPNVSNLVRDIDGQLYEIERYQGGSMMDAHPPNVPSGHQHFGGYQAPAPGYGPPSYQSNVPGHFQDTGNHHNQGFGSAPPPPTQHTNSNVPTQSEDIEEPRGRTIERDAGYLRHHRRTAQRGNILWGQELDDRNNADRVRGETFLGGDVDSGELLTLLQFQAPFPERRAPREEEGLRTPRALSPPRVQIIEPSPIAMSENASGHMPPHGGRASAPPGPPSTDMGGLRGYFVTPLYQALNAQDSLRRSSLPASEGRSSSTDSSGENRIFGELAGTVRAPSQEGKGRKLWKKDSEDEDKDSKDRRF
ncbi:hypothetical protein DL98DRAFT_213088 [Cadophora sp. DSE1049]|nr:hypothetical protein DL98DRAFT_213088 [Cadophora sp. DSE1049]